MPTNAVHLMISPSTSLRLRPCQDPLLPVSTPAAGEEEADNASVPATPSSPSPEPPLPTSTVLVRLATLVTLAFLSLWANHEASRGFGFDVVNAAAGTPAGRRFDFMLVSNGRAFRAVLDASREVERALYPAGAAEEKKPVQHVTLRLANGNLSANVVVLRGGRDQFVLHVSSGIMFAADANGVMRAAVHRGMARVWLRDGQGGAPEDLLDAMAEYLAVSGGLDGAALRPVGTGTAQPPRLREGRRAPSGRQQRRAGTRRCAS